MSVFTNAAHMLVYMCAIVTVFCTILAIRLPNATAVEALVRSQTIGDAYAHLRTDGTEVPRRRIHQLLGLDLFDLAGDGSNSLFFVSSFRFSGDFGVEQRDLDAGPQLDRQDIAILYAYLEARNIAGFLDISAGRQYEIDAIDMLLYDGIRLRAKTPWYFGVEVLSGVEARNGWGPVSVNSHELDGTIEQLLTENGKTEDAAPRLVLGAGVFLTDLAYTQLEIGFRRIQELSSDGFVNQQRLGGVFSQRIVEGLFVDGSLSFDFYQSLINEIRGGVRYRPIHMIEVEAQYQYLIPSFDADSIWNVFSWRPLNRAQERLRVFFGESLFAYVGTYQSFYGADSSVTQFSVDETVQDLGFSGGARWTVERGTHVYVDFTTQFGYGGDHTMVDVGGQVSFLDNTLALDARLMLILFEDQVQQGLNGTMFGAQISGSWQFAEQGRLQLLVEEASTQLQPAWVRVLALVDLELWL